MQLRTVYCNFLAAKIKLQNHDLNTLFLMNLFILEIQQSLLNHNCLIFFKLNTLQVIITNLFDIVDVLGNIVKFLDWLQ